MKGLGIILSNIAIRVLIWSSSIVAIAMPVIFLSKPPVTLSLPALAASANQVGHFSDFFFLTIVVCSFGLNSIFSHVFTHRNIRMGFLTFVSMTILSVYFLGVLLLYAVPHAVELGQARGAYVLAEIVIQHDIDIIRNTLIAGLAAEVAVGLRVERQYGATA